ncbi:MAG: dienelactone hydrolase family protein [Armatimonas sp.]
MDDTISRRTLLAAGFALAVQPVSADTIQTSAQGLTAGEAQIPAPDGVMVPAYFARPENGKQLPVVLVVQEIFGVHEHIKDVCRRLAHAGYFAVAPSLYHRQGDVTKLAMQEIFPIVQKVPDKQVLSDLDATVKWAQGTKVANTKQLAITGFCWGGRVCWLYAAHRKDLKAACPFYGRLVGDATELQPIHPIDVIKDLKAPVLGFYGGKDKGIPLESIERVRKAAEESKKSVEIIVYPDSEHGFHADYRPSYNEKDAKDAYAKMLAFFKKNGMTTAAPEPAEKLLNAAQSTAGKSKRNVFVRYTASWCGWCHLMAKSLEDPAVKPLWEKAFVSVTLDVLEEGAKKADENPGADKQLEAMGGATGGIPFFAVLDPKGKKLIDSNLMPGGKNIGCPAAPDEIVKFDDFLKTGAPKLTEAERETILEVFRKNAPKN